MRDNDSQKIIVVGIPKTMDDAGLSELFSSFGTVAEAKAVLDVNNKQPRGFGFVTFTSGAAMRAAIQGMNKKVVDGRTLNVRQLVPKDKFKAEKAKDETAQDAASRPCWLLRKGKCTKGDLCPFSHETKNGEFGSCFEFMQTGECKRGDKCIFSHKIADATASGDSAAAQKEPISSSNGTGASASVPRTDTKPGAADGEPKKRVCYAFQKGKCHRGKKCLFLHEKVPEMANDQPVVVAKTPATAAASAAARGEFEVVTQAADTKKRSRVDSHDDDDEDDETVLAAMKPSAAKKLQLSHTAATATDKKSAVSATRPAAGALQSRDRVAAAAPTNPAVPVRSVKSEPQQTTSAPAATATPAAPAATKRPRDDDNSATTKQKKPFEKRPRFDPSTAGVDKPLHPAAKRISERELKRNGPSKYGDGQAIAQQTKPKAKLSANDRFAKRAARNNKSALQRQKRKLRAATEQQSGGGDSGDKPAHDHAAPAKKRPTERVDMGAAFDGLSDDDRKPRKARVVDKAQQKANREKAQLERKAKREAKKTALSRLQTQDKVEL